MTNLLIKQILQKPNILGRLVKWAIELSKYNTQYDTRGLIKAHVLSDFLVELTTLTESKHEDIL